MKKSFFYYLLLTLLTIAIEGNVLQATIVIKMDILELVRNSCSIVLGEIVDIEKNWEMVRHPKGSFTLNVTLKLKVEKSIKSCPQTHEGNIISIERLGGKSEGFDLSIPGAPTFKNNTKVLLFLTELPSGKHVITGFSQGKFRILKDSETQEEIAVQDKNARALLLVDQNTHKIIEAPIPEYTSLKNIIDEINKNLYLENKNE